MILSGLGVFLPTLILYLVTSYPVVAYIDSGELAMVNGTLGIAHPTGYPLYTLLGRIFSLLPLQLITTQSLLGAICTAAAVTGFFFIVASVLRLDSRQSSAVDKRRHKSLSVRMPAALVLAVSPLLWSQGVTNEVYGLHLLFLSLLLFLILQPYRLRNLIIGGYLLGLSFGNHMSTVLIVPAVIAYLFINRKSIFESMSPIFGAVLAGFLGASIYLYLPIRSSLDPIFNWGHPTTWGSFVRHVSGWQYQVWMFNRGASELLGQLGKFAGILFDQFPLPFWGFVAVGIYYGFKLHRQLVIYPALLLIFNIIYSLNFSIPDIDNYLLPSVVALFLFAAFGIVELIHRLRVAGYVPPLIMAAIILWGLLLNWGRNNQSGNTSALDGVHNYYQSTEGEALILSANWDYVSPWYYSHFYLRERPDVMFVDPELTRRSWYFDWIRHADPKLYDFIKPEIEAFLPHVRRFEAKESFDQTRIEQTYQAILRKLMTYPQRHIYFDQSVKLSFVPPGEVVTSGQLYRLVRKEEAFASPDRQLTPPNFGKSADNLDWREKWHLEEFEKMQIAAPAAVGK